MNFYVNNTEKITNFPESGIIVLPYYNDGRTSLNTNYSKITVDENHVYYHIPNFSFRTKNINNLVALDSDGNIVNQLKPYIGGFATSLGTESFKIIYSDNTYIYAYIDNLFLNKNSQTNTLQIYRIFKRNYTIDPNFCLTMPAVGASVNNLKMFIYNNKYYIIAQSQAGILYSPYFYKDQNSSLGLYIIKNKQLISNFKLNQAGIILKLKSYNGQIYGSHSAGQSEINKIQYPKIFRLNNKNLLDQSFYPFIDRYNNSSTVAAGSVVSQVADFAFVNDGIFIGGNFQSVGGDPCTGLAKIDYSGNRITGFNAKLGYSISTTTSVNIAAVASSGSGVFIGGPSTMYSDGNTAITRLLKLHDDGSLNSQFTGHAVISANTVQSLLLSGDSLYVGGLNLGSPGQIYGLGFFKLNADNGSVDPNFNVTLAGSQPNDIKISGNSLYVALNAPDTWYNNNLPQGTVTRTGVIKVNASNGEPDANFQINFNQHISAPSLTSMALKGNELHICGFFSGIEGKKINSYAIVNSTNGSLIDTNNYFYDAGNSVILRGMDYDTDNLIIGGQTSSSRLGFYITGYNSEYNSSVQIYDQNFIPETGISSQIFLNNQLNFNYSTGIPFLANNTGLILSGNNAGYSLACALNLDNLNTNTTTFYLSGSPKDSINTIQNYNNDYFFGGTFTNLGCKDFTTGINYLVKTNSSGVIDKNFNLFLTGIGGVPQSPAVYTLKVVSDSLYGCGVFTGISGIRNFFKYNLTSGFLETGFNYLSNYVFFPQDIIADNKNNIYVSVNNNYTSFSGNFFRNGDSYTQTSGQILKFNSGSYNIDPTFTNKHFSIASKYLHFDDNKIYAGLISQGKSVGSNIYKINRKTRQIDSSNAYISGTSVPVYDMYNEGNYLYIVGGFSGVNNTSITGFCRLNKSDLSVDTSFNFNIGSGIDNKSPYKMVKKDNYLYCMGDFDKVNTTSITGLARFDLTNDTLDTSFKIDFSGAGLGFHFHLGGDFSGNNLYLAGLAPATFTPALSIIDIQNKLLKFTGINLEASLASNLYTIENVGDGLIAGLGTNTTVTNSKQLLARARGLVHLGYISGEISNPYTFWAGSNTTTFPYFKYHQFSDSIFMIQNANVGNSNNVLGAYPNIAPSYFIIDRNKKFMKSKFSFTNVSATINLSNNIIPFVYNNELYMDCAASLLPKKDFPYQRFIRNLTQRSIIKFNANFDDYEIII